MTVAVCDDTLTEIRYTTLKDTTMQRNLDLDRQPKRSWLTRRWL